MAVNIGKYRIPKNLAAQWATRLHDLMMVPVAWLLAYWVRFNLDSFPESVFDSGVEALLIILPVQLLVFQRYKIHLGIWRFTSLTDLLRIIKATLLGVMLSMLALFIITRADGIPRSVPVFYITLLFMLLTGPRLLFRLIKDRHLYLTNGKRVLIIGAGSAGEMLSRDIQRNRLNKYQPIAFVDDNPNRLGREIHGIQIAGHTSDIPRLTKKLGIDLLMIAIPSANREAFRRIVEICESTDVPFKSVPQLDDLVSGRVEINNLREISIEDLLGREPVSLDWEAIEQSLSGKTILVTGAGGSIGSELCRQLARIRPSAIILLDHGEYNLYQIDRELAEQYPKMTRQAILADVTDQVGIENVISTTQPEVIFHAAAYKHVPLLEDQIRQAVRNNVIGTRIVADAAVANGCKQFVMVSTDKAVNPANIMGATKRAAEIYCQNLNAQGNTNFITVRFGNVLGSAGSVIPLFKQQIANGGPITVTDPRMERYFMTIPEASQLILQTTTMAKGGEVFVLDMGEPVKIAYLAEQMIRLSGKLPGEDIQIEYIGLRPGEKLYEELFHESESMQATEHEKVFLAQHRKMEWDRLIEKYNEMAVASDSFSEIALANIISSLVPEHEQQTKTDQSVAAETHS